MTPKSLVIHGHFYQPPREEPWLEEIEAEPSAAPCHDWNERIEQQCYRAVVAARIPGAEGRISRIVNTLESISFNFGPTLLEWLERKAPTTYRAVLAADRSSVERLGFGNAIAMPYHHAILPLSTPADRQTEIRWGIADFRRRFGRMPQGMWLPETAVDAATLDALAIEGIQFTIVAPHQVEGAPADGSPGRFRTSSGREITLCVYDGAIAADVAFGALLNDATAWRRRLLAEGKGPARRLVAVATDGETYGHHHAFGEMALAGLIESVTTEPGVRLENFASYL
ncbi:MAG: glycoside hydrolase, partial [Gemmatimonadota bacterium]